MTPIRDDRAAQFQKGALELAILGELESLFHADAECVGEDAAVSVLGPDAIFERIPPRAVWAARAAPTLFTLEQVLLVAVS